MHTPRTFALLIASAFVITSAPAQAGERVHTELVEIQVDLSASAAEIYDQVRAQAWAVCKPELGSTYAAARNQVRRECQKQVTADALKQLAREDAIMLAQSRDQKPQ